MTDIKSMNMEELKELMTQIGENRSAQSRSMAGCMSILLPPMMKWQIFRRA